MPFGLRVDTFVLFNLGDAIGLGLRKGAIPNDVDLDSRPTLS